MWNAMKWAAVKPWFYSGDTSCPPPLPPHPLSLLPEFMGEVTSCSFHLRGMWDLAAGRPHVGSDVSFLDRSPLIRACCTNRWEDKNPPRLSPRISPWWLTWSGNVIWTFKVSLGKIFMLGATERSAEDDPFCYRFAWDNLKCHDGTWCLS